MKVTVNAVIIFVISLLSCQQADNSDDRLTYLQQMDSIAGKKVDSAYRAITMYCDTIADQKVAFLVDSLVKMDTLQMGTQ